MENRQFFEEGIQLHQELLALCEKEEGLVIRNDVHQLVELVGQKEKVIAQVKDWEKECLKRKSELSAKEVEELRDACQRVQLRMAQVCYLLQTSLETIYAQLDVLLERAGPATYSSVGREKETAHLTSLFSRRI